MRDDDIETEDTAAEAFARLEGEVALVRRAVQQLAAEKAEICIPDYSSTLGELVKRLGSAERTLKTIEDKPAMELTPEEMVQRINRAARQARESDEWQLGQAQERFEKGAHELRGIASTMRTIDEQRRHLLWAIGGGILAGCLLWSILPGAILRSLPQSWNMPEKMAAHIVGAPSVWEGGVRLMRAGSPEAYEAIAAAAVIRQHNREKIAGCEKAALDEDKEVPCTIRIDPPPRRYGDTAALNQWGRARLRLIRTPSTITGNWRQLRGCPFAATLQAKAGIAGTIVDRFLSNA